MSLTLTVDGERWRRHLRLVADTTPGLVPVAKGNGYGFGVARLARKSDWLGVDTMDQETALAESEERDQRRGMLNDALKGLNARERRVFEARRLTDEPLTLEELSSEFGVSRERIRQIEVRAFEKVQRAVQKAAATSAQPEHALPG